MKFTQTKLEGAYIIELEKHTDDRGFFARTFCAREFEARRLVSRFVQCNTSFNVRRGTIRGLHFQNPPDTEAKLIRCTRGSIFDAVIDLRPKSSTYGNYFALELSAENGKSLYIPAGFAHGFQTLEDGSEVFYQMTSFYAPGSSGGIRYDDPDIAVRWPLPVSVISSKDLEWPRLKNWNNSFPVQ